MSIPTDLKFTRDHEWAKLSGNTVTIGITAFACEQLGDIVFVDLPKVGQSAKAGGTLGAVESTKTVSDVFSPVSGKVVEVNSSLGDSPQTVNQSPYGEGWLAKIELDNVKELEGLLDAAAYAEHVKGSGH